MATLDYVHHLAFPKLSESEVEGLAGMARICSFQDGELIFQAGQRGLPFYVVASGAIAIVDESADVPKTVVVHGPRELTGDVPLLTDRPAVISAYARGETRAYCVRQAELRRVLQEIPDLRTSCSRRSRRAGSCWSGRDSSACASSGTSATPT